jgi:hypothetical protein
MFYNLNFSRLSTKKWNILYIVLAAIITILVGFSRLALGAHSLNQILLGWTYGLYEVYLYVEIVGEITSKFLAGFMIDQYSFYNNNFIEPKNTLSNSSNSDLANTKHNENPMEISQPN